MSVSVWWWRRRWQRLMWWMWGMGRTRVCSANAATSLFPVHTCRLRHERNGSGDHRYGCLLRRPLLVLYAMPCLGVWRDVLVHRAVVRTQTDACARHRATGHGSGAARWYARHSCAGAAQYSRADASRRSRADTRRRSRAYTERRLRTSAARPLRTGASYGCGSLVGWDRQRLVLSSVSGHYRHREGWRRRGWRSIGCLSVSLLIRY